MKKANQKRANGEFYTTGNPFNHEEFELWAKECDLQSATVLEPFAGAGNLPALLEGCTGGWVGYDINPPADAYTHVTTRDTIADFPAGFDVCITNPPYLSKSSATSRGLPFPNTKYDDLWKLSLSLCLKNCKYVAAILPASFLNSGLFRDRLYAYILLSTKMFSDTEHPVCLALFVPTRECNEKGAEIYDGDVMLMRLSHLELMRHYYDNLGCPFDFGHEFNHPEGEIGLYALDNSKEPSIRFCRGEEVAKELVKPSSRCITRIKLSSRYENLPIDAVVKYANDYMWLYRCETKDLLLTPCLGLRMDGKYRRRLRYKTASLLLEKGCEDLQQCIKEGRAISMECNTKCEYLKWINNN